MPGKRATQSQKTVKNPGKSGTAKSRPAARSVLFQIHISLLGSQPEIWRSVVVPGELDIGALHRVLQAAMGWSGKHAHYFNIGNTRYSDSEFDIEHADAINEAGVRLFDVVPRERDSFTYLYDPGSDWECEILVEKISERGEKFPGYPVCLDGESACPPEDCGGIGNYGCMVSAINAPDSFEGGELSEWTSDSFDPELCDFEEINRRLRKVT